MNELSDRLFFYEEILSSMGIKKKKEIILSILCQNSLFDDMYIMFDELTDTVEASSTLIRQMLKELDEDGLILKKRYGKKIGYSANLTKMDEFKN